MGAIKHYMERQVAQASLAKHLDHLLDADLIENKAAKGIAKQVRDLGKDRLSPKQAFTFRKYVEVPFCQPACQYCGDRIPVQDAWDAEQGDIADTCASCEYDLAKHIRS